MALHIRKYREADRALLQGAIAGLHRHIADLDSLRRLELPRGYTDGLTADVLKMLDDGSGVVLIAEEDGAFVGMVTGYVANRPSVNQGEVASSRVGHINDVFVVAEQRRRGVGTKLVQTLEQHLLDRGCAVLWVSTVAFNNEAKVFYEHVGYLPRRLEFMKAV